MALFLIQEVIWGVKSNLPWKSNCFNLIDLIKFTIGLQSQSVHLWKCPWGTIIQLQISDLQHIKKKWFSNLKSSVALTCRGLNRNHLCTFNYNMQHIWLNHYQDILRSWGYNMVFFTYTRQTQHYVHLYHLMHNSALTENWNSAGEHNAVTDVCIWWITETQGVN